MYCDKSVVTVPFDDNVYLKHIILYINPHEKEKNEAIFGLRETYLRPEHLETFQNLFGTFALEEDGLELVTRRLPFFHNWVRDGLYEVNSTTPGHLEIKPPVSIRASLNSLRNKGFLSENDRYYIEPHLTKLEKAADFASHISSEISTAQKDIILAMIEPYMEDLKREMDSSDELERWIMKFGGVERIVSGPLDLSLVKAVSFTTEFIEKSDDFFESLLPVVKVYNGTSNLETALLQNGVSLPSKEMIMSIIKEKFDSV